ncbi:MAG: glycosyltransferase, partial [Actinomycetota bacterium]|nr:glycosyltransferase [Actinomycetota bacterium]
VVQEVPITTEPLERFTSIIGATHLQRLRDALTVTGTLMAGRTLWHVNSTAAGGGVAEMLPVLLAYLRGAGVDARWVVVGGRPDFFTVTKRLHNHLHGSRGDGGELGGDERACYDAVADGNAGQLTRLVRRGDVAVLHDPQTAGLVEPLREAGATVIWRCHVGCDTPNGLAHAGWSFLRPYLEAADAYVFSRRPHVHPWMPRYKVRLVPPSIDPFAAKNQPLEADAARAIVGHLGLISANGVAPAYRNRDGASIIVQRRAEIVRGGATPTANIPLVVQVSRWDRLKDMLGVMRAFAAGVDHGAHLALVGPSVASVADDPEGAEVLDECVRAWERLPAPARDRIHLVCLPMDDLDENAAMVNAIQRHAAVVVQKSLAEGFGLTVTEAMWKARPVVASAVGGIQDQIVDGRHGMLVPDPADLPAFARAVQRLLTEPHTAARLGRNARRRVLGRFLGNRHLIQDAELLAGVSRRN